MVKELVHDPMRLAVKSVPATKADTDVIRDLKDTLAAHRATCAGMAANMIGVNKNIIIAAVGAGALVMVNARITAKKGAYETEEGCLSLLGGPRKTTRYEQIDVSYEDERFVKRTGRFTGWTAQIIQHELDHVNGVLI